MKLNVKTKKFICVDYHELEKFIIQHQDKLGINVPSNYSIPISEQLQNYTHKLYLVDREEVDEYDQSKLRETLRFQLITILKMLAKLDIIEYGKYLVQVSW